MTTRDWTNALVKETVERRLETLFKEMWKDKDYKRFSMKSPMLETLQAQGVDPRTLNAIDETFKRHIEVVARSMFLLGLEKALMGEWDLWNIVRNNADTMHPFPYDLDMMYGVYDVPFVQSCTVALDEMIEEEHKKEQIAIGADF